MSRRHVAENVWPRATPAEMGTSRSGNTLSWGAGGLWGFIQGILILAKSMNEDAEGRPLTE